MPAESPAASATSIYGSSAVLNGGPMASGATLFPGDVIQLGAGSSAAVQFGKNLVLATSQTEFVVEPLGVRLLSGRIQVRAGDRDSFAVTGPFFNLNIGLPTEGASSAEVLVTRGHAKVATVSGAAELTAAGNAPFELHAGETATLDTAANSAAADSTTGSPQDSQGANNPEAGKVSRLVPQVQIDRSSKVRIVQIADKVYWNDDLRSGPSGRARVTLADGSLLSLGSNSEMHVLQHDAKAQQTSLDLAVGRMRGQVMKLTRPGSKFEVHTPMGVAGLVGTDFSVFVTPDYAELIVFEGVVRFTLASNGQAITVNAGMKLRIPRTGPAVGPEPVSPDEIQTAQNLTDAPKGSVPNIAGRNGPGTPVIVSVVAGGATIGIGYWLDSRQPLSPWKLGDGTAAPVVK